MNHTKKAGILIIKRPLKCDIKELIKQLTEEFYPKVDSSGHQVFKHTNNQSEADLGNFW